jgi:RNA polymerase sigma factor (sigma-70 family)
MRVRQEATIDQLEAIYAAELSRFVRTARAITGDSEVAQDAVHDAFVSCVRGRGRYRATGSLEAWVWRAVVTSSLKLLRGNRRTFQDVWVPERQSLESEESIDIELVRRAVAAMPERQRLCLFLRYYADLDYATIASALAVEVGTVAATLNAAHRGLRTTLEEVLSA